jgi:hypothetical protein
MSTEFLGQPPSFGVGTVNTSQEGGSRTDRRDAALRRLRDTVAGEYRVHPSVVAGLKAETLAWMTAFRWGPLHGVRACRVP